ncbi:NAD-dependent epimerase/dehydratase family protein [Pseudomonas sp. EpS/L25]|uniref:NAD-dependent epimerase/dehydratase family protein n=1 Tax=Pseudomonas sp. EpS/L25 TaxID=1749078 RepID=UPI000743F02E|nr:NAD(P)-dependent oxidoreductase [Pseudomonas sp. EpS/L25]KUM44990.1 3-beta hydroxysteroid dehydrogenase [Pseudomonas sp. EpS/L25]
MRILITGASEALGAGLACDLLDRGQLVRVHGRPGATLDALVERGAEYRPALLDQPEQVVALCDDIDAIAHCADVAGVPTVAALSQGHVLIEACLQQRVAQFVYVSSARVYERGGEGLKEDQVPAKPRGVEAQRRLQLERLALAAGEFGPQVTVLRPAQVLGLADRDWARWLLERARAKQLWRHGNGLNRWDFTSAESLRQALVTLLLEQPAAASGKVFNLSDGQPLVCWDAINFLLRRFELPAVGEARTLSPRALYARLRTPRQEARWPDLLDSPFTLEIRAAQEAFGFRPQAGSWAALEEYRPAQRQPRSGPV